MQAPPTTATASPSSCTIPAPRSPRASFKPALKHAAALGERNHGPVQTSGRFYCYRDRQGSILLRPAATEAYAVLLRYDYDMRGRFRKQPSQLDAIYAGALDRSVLGIDWNIQKPIDVMLVARNVRINQDRKGRFKPLRDDAGDDLRALVENIAAATESAPPDRRKRRRCTTRESQRLLRSQEQEEFLATAACPGCGELNTHAMRTPHQGDPSWAEVIRICGVCNREWAHG